jgi:MoaA/NifB/PqqE/SkfB family radical SAM enzyme
MLDQASWDSENLLEGIVDIELTNRCNAHCGFCPRDQTPHQGLMEHEVFAQAVARVVEVREQAHSFWEGCRGVAFCGLGDQLLHPDLARHVRSVRDAGLEIDVNTNGALLDEERGRQLLDAGVTRVLVNAGEIGAAYEPLYRLPFERVRENVRRFAAMSEGRCTLYVVLVDHARDQNHVDEVARFWRTQGVDHFLRLDLLNRAGTLEYDDMDYQRFPQQQEARERLAATGTPHACHAPFQFPFIGYDGKYYLCSSDWKKEVSFGTVFEHSILEIVRQKYEYLLSQEPICRSCNHDPLNRLTGLLVARDAGRADDNDVDELVGLLESEAGDLNEVIALVDAHLGDLAGSVDPPPQARARRRLIPVRVA